MHFKNNFLLYLALGILGFCSYITAFGIVPFSDIKYQLTLPDSIIFIALYIVLQMTILLYMDKASSVKFDIGLSIFSFVSVNFFFSYVGIGNVLELYNYFNNNPDYIADPQKFSALTINIALIVDLIFINIFNVLYLKRLDYYKHNGAQEAEDRINKEQKAKAEKKKADAKKKAQQLEKDLVIANHDANA